MSWLADNIVVLAVAALLGSYAWVFGGTRGDLLPSFVPWLSLVLVEVALFFPQRTRYEKLASARLRVWREIKSDRLVWVCALFIALLAVPLFNTWLKAFPWCVSVKSHLNVFLWFTPSLLAMIAVKHSLRRRGKRTLLKLLVWNGVALGAFGFLQLYTGAEGPFWTSGNGATQFFSTFGYPNMAGDYFTSLTFLAIGYWRLHQDEVDKIEKRRMGAYEIFTKKHYPLIAVAILYFSALNTLSRSAILLSTSGVVLLGTLICAVKMKRFNRARRVRYIAMMVLSVIGITLFALLFTPESVRKEVGTLNTTEVLNRVTSKNEYHSRVAGELLSDYPMFGCGGWGYAYLSPEKIPEIAKRCEKYGWSAGSANVHNDYLQFLCEHGFTGFGLLLIIVGLAIRPAAVAWRRLAATAKFTRHTGLPWPKGFFCFPMAGIATYAAAVATLIHAFGDCPLRSPAVMSLFFVELVMVDGFLPRET